MSIFTKNKGEEFIETYEEIKKLRNAKLKMLRLVKSIRGKNLTYLVFGQSGPFWSWSEKEIDSSLLTYDDKDKIRGMVLQSIKNNIDRINQKMEDLEDELQEKRTSN